MLTMGKKGRKKSGVKSGAVPRGKPVGKPAANKGSALEAEPEGPNSFADSLSPGVLQAWSFITRPAMLAALCVLAAFAVRYYVAPFYAKGPDNFQYVALAKEIASGEYFQKDYDLDRGLMNSRRVVPFYPMLIAPWIKLGADPEKAGCWVSVIMAALTVVPLFGAGMKLWDKWSGFFASFFYMILGAAMDTAGHILTEDTFVFLTMASIWAVLGLVEKPGLRLSLVAGLLCALSYLTREIGLGYIFLSAAALALRTWLADKRWKEAAKCVAAAFAVFAVLSSPFWVFVRVHTGEWSPTLRKTTSFTADVAGYEKGSRQRFPGEDEGAGPVEEAQAEVEISLPGVAAKSLRLAGDYLAAAYRRVPWVFLAFLLAGVFLVPGDGGLRFAKEAVPWTWALGVALAYALITPYMVDQRYYLPVVVISCLWAGRGVAATPSKAQRIAGTERGSYARRAVVLLAAAGIVFYAVKSWELTSYVAAFYSRENFRNKTVSGHKEAALEAKRRLRIKPGKKICARKPYAAYYLDGVHVTLAETVDGVRRQVSAGRCDYVFIGSMSVRRYRPGLKELVTATGSLGDAGLVYRRYLIDYNKLFSVYQRGAPTLSVDVRVTEGNANALVVEANELVDAGYVEHARQMLEAVLSAQPENRHALLLMTKVQLIYGRYDGESLDRAEDYLMRYSLLSPNDRAVREYKRIINDIRQRHVLHWGPR